jgi:glycosyltransferase involved in cell wall biosynthesis
MNHLTVVAIFKNESHILREWIEHYLREGVDAFLLVDNGSTDDPLRILEPYIESRIVELVADSRRHRQAELYNEHFLEKCRASSWVMIVDLDEFVYARKGFRTIPDYLHTLDQSVGEIYIPWKNFGSSGFIAQPQSVVLSFTHRADYDHRQINSSIDGHRVLCKVIVRGRTLKRIKVHCSVTRRRMFSKLAHITSDGLAASVHSNFQYVSEITLENSALHLNHYVLQSMELFQQVKMTRGDASSSKCENVRTIAYFEKFDVNDVVDRELALKRARDVPDICKAIV